MRPKNLVPLAHVEHGWAFGNSLAVFGDDIGGVVQMPLDEMETFPSLPFGVAIARDKTRAYVSASGSNEVLILDLAKLVAAARSPQAARLANDLSASAKYVLAHVCRWGATRATSRSRRTARRCMWPTGSTTPFRWWTRRARRSPPPSRWATRSVDAERRGERLFYSSMYSFGHQFGCANCHIDATFDGLSWDLEPDGFGIDIVDNRMLEEVKDTAPYQWNGGNPDLQTECGPRTETLLLPLARLSRRGTGRPGEVYPVDSSRAPTGTGFPTAN